MQAPSAQHGAPGAPQATQVLVAVEQTRSSCRQLAGVVPTAGQQASPAFWPHAAHTALTHRVPGPVQSVAVAPTVALQHGRPGPPQPVQEPLAQTPGSGAQLAPLAAHRPEMQQPPPAQALPAQHVWLGAPQAGPIGLSPPVSRGASAPVSGLGASGPPSITCGTSGVASSLP
jgi:hypothetical protein